ncbi:D-alanine:D-lactate ligase-like protein [Pseudaminobacter arsenicus]|uniref:D-alanine:D-lactate ligase-like protein n=1 Tax=Borborobacter arsenicus TaxID=1851146 RepID=A0A432V4C4_9HYPH|nr:D-alanine:D-lactate ligase-like protein [Pseudaminobacter arsenicus]RUM97074.1 D-alanine:D-lactate ligase-like protein [Pseudaminobacter arsenicus]
MADQMPTLLLVHETEKACLDRLATEGFAAERAAEISSYLAQSTDLAPEFDAIAQACAQRGLRFEPVALDEASATLAGRKPEVTLVWTLTDGIAYFRGGAGPALARLNGLPTFGSDDSLFALCQDKFRSGAVLGALGLPVPAAGLAHDGQWLVEPQHSKSGYFVKPNRLGAKIGIYPDSHCHSPDTALALSRRIFEAYRDDAIVQPYVTGRNVRLSFLEMESGAGAEAFGISFVNAGGDFQTMQDSLALYGETGAEACARGVYAEPDLLPVAASQPEAANKIKAIALHCMRTLGLRDVFSMDFRVEPDDTVHLIEFEICPGLPCFDFRAYCREHWKLDLAEAMAAAAAGRFQRRSMQTAV